MHLKVRPFVEEIHEQLVCTGSVREGGFVLRVHAAEFKLPTIAIGQDPRGEFAILDESRSELEGGAVLSVEAYADDETDPVGRRISLFRPASTSELEWTALIKGYEPQSINVVGSNESGFAIYFTSTGHVDGHARALPRGK